MGTHGSSGSQSALLCPPQGDLQGDFNFSCSMTQVWSRRLPEASPSQRSPHSHPGFLQESQSIPGQGFSSLPQVCSSCFSLQCNTTFHTPALWRARDFAHGALSAQTQPLQGSDSSSAGPLTHRRVRGKENTRELILLIPPCQSCMDSPADIWQRLPGWSNPSKAARARAGLGVPG